MAKPRQSSFRRLLFTRILLLSIPVLLVGEYVVYRKARSGLLETAQLNLTSSAIRKGETIKDLLEAYRSNLVTASEAFSPQIDRPEKGREFVSRLSRSLPKAVQCIQLTNMQTGQIEASTCGKQPVSRDLDRFWSNSTPVALDPQSNIRISSVNPDTLAKLATPLRQLYLVLHAPIFDSSGQLHYALSMQVALHTQADSQQGTLSGDTVVFDQEGTILAHPRTSQIGRNISQEGDGAVLQGILTAILANPEKQDFLHLFAFDPDGSEWLAAYSPIKIPVRSGEDRTWVVMAVAPISSALFSLEEVKQILMVLTLGLLGASLLATIYVARDLALPLEQLGDYALHIDQRHGAERAPRDFKVREINHLAEALDSMVRRLAERAEELEAAWQEAQVANQLKSAFLATTSHELRTPLNAIIGCLRLVKDGCCDSPEEELDFLQRADDASIHLLKIIDDLLNISKIEAGKVELQLQPTSIQDLCQQCLRMVQPGADNKGLTLSLEVAPHLDRVALDERRVRQMVINLLSNAVKFTPEGGQVRLRAWTGYGHQLEQDIRPDRSPVNSSTPYLCLEVKDSGIGIPEDRWHLLFRPFQQVDSSLTRRHEGTGLGLALTKRLAELHGGTISFQSVPNQGSTFRIWLPSREVQPSTEAAIAHSSPDNPPNGNTADGTPSIDAPDSTISSRF
ncbi:sensor histidine kinase [Leptothermofonsia sichuanensis E412]|uniref:sensor histidine kinase n=1 Tax=Leptothermofonsia sichuanensis TaxID=2917832 RepID=UPI001CA69A66|nr:ATP-binding protein [Leptothermofonsia sichuanensis]QZZ20128.1 sensor histidine kinase [Leptothermofonsia sichuanensis E412]